MPKPNLWARNRRYPIYPEEIVNEFIEGADSDHREYVIAKLYDDMLQNDRLRALALLKTLTDQSDGRVPMPRDCLDIILEIREHFDPRTRAFIINELLCDMEVPQVRDQARRFESLAGEPPAIGEIIGDLFDRTYEERKRVRDALNAAAAEWDTPYEEPEAPPAPA